MKQGSTTIAFSYLVEKIDFVIPWPQNRVYKLSAQVTRLTTLCIEFSIKIPTMWYIATLVPLGVQRILFLPGSSKGLLKYFKLCKLDSTFEGILWLHLKSKTCDISFNICVCFLPPLNSSRQIDHCWESLIKCVLTCILRLNLILYINIEYICDHVSILEQV